MRFNIGDSVVYYYCGNNHYDDLLTIGKSYVVNFIDIPKEDNYFIEIINDLGDNIWFRSKRFISLSKYREIKINRLINKI